MATLFSTLAWKIPWTEGPGGLQSMGLLRVGHNWATSLSLFTFMHWRRKWQPTPVFLPGECQGRGSLVGCHLWGCTESDTTEATSQQQQQHLPSIPAFWRVFIINGCWILSKNFLMKVKESENVGLKCNIQKTKIMACGPITSWQIDGETVETVADCFFFWRGRSKITADGDCSHEIKRHKWTKQKQTKFNIHLW